MIATNVVALAAVTHRPYQNRFERAVIIGGVTFFGFRRQIIGQRHQIKDRRGEVGNLLAILMGHITGHRQGFEVISNLVHLTPLDS